jgi:hypothetical protein
MPPYVGNGQATLVRVNRQGFLWNNESVPVATWPVSLSQAFLLERLDNASYPWGASFELYFFGNPGASFEVDILGANIDAATNYVQLGSITQASATSISGSGGYVYRYDMASNLWPKYVAAWMKTLTNAVNVTLMVTR